MGCVYGRGSMSSGGQTKDGAQMGRAQPDCIPLQGAAPVGRV